MILKKLARIMRRVFKILEIFYHKHKIFVVSFTLIVIAQEFLALILPEMTGELLNIAVYENPDVAHITMLVHQIILLVVVSLLHIGFLTVRGYLSRRYEAIAAATIKEKLLNKMSFIKYKSLKTDESGHYNRVINIDTDNIRSLAFNDPITFVINIIYGAGIVIFMFRENVFLSVIALASVAVILFLSYYLIPVVMSSNRRVVQNYDTLSNRVNTLYNDDINIKSHNIREAYRARNRSMIKSLRDAEFTAAHHDVIYEHLSVTGVHNIINIVLYSLGAYFVILGELQIGTLTAFIVYYSSLWQVIEGQTHILMHFSIKQNSARRIQEMLALPLEDHAHDEDCRTHDIGPFKKLTLENVAYQIDGDLILHDMNLEINKGDRIIVLGNNGSGKSSFGRLIAMLYDYTDGRILYNGQDYKDIYESACREHILYVPPESASEDFLYDELESLNESDDNKNPELIAEHYLEHSSGEKKYRRIMLALKRDVDFYIFDEPTAFTDEDKEHQIIDMISNLPADKTVMVITQDASIWKNYNKIYFLHHKSIEMQEIIRGSEENWES